MAERINRAMHRRRSARLAAVQALYQLAVGGDTASNVVEQFLAERLTEVVEGVDLSEADRELFKMLVEGASAERSDLDDMLSAVLTDDWPVERLETLLRTLMHAAVYELAHGTDTPARVVISEYVDIAHAFFGGKEPAMVNGLLDKLARELRGEEFAADQTVPGLDRA